MPKPKIEKRIHVPNEVILELLTPSEIRMLKNRWEIINLLKEGLSIRNIAKKVKVGTDTVVRVARMSRKNDVKKVIEPEIPFKTSTPWIFGKSND